MPTIHPAELDVRSLLEQCDIQTTRRSGPGGQHRNKVESAVVITHRPTGMIGQASEQRSQHENRKRAIRRLRVNLALAVRVPRKPENFLASELWRSRIVATKIVVNAAHEDFPALLAESLDAIQACQFDLARAAGLLHCTSSQLIKFLKLQPHALNWVNQSRKDSGRKPYN